MPPQPTAQPNGQPGFLRSGWLELRRKLERRKLRKQAQQLDLQRTAALGQLGQAARKSNIDLSSFPGFHEHLSRIETRTDELNATAKKLAEAKASLEARRQSETARFDAQRQAVETQKRLIDASLQAAKNRLAEQNQLVQRLQNRLAALPAEINQCDQQIAALSASSAQDKTSQFAAAQSQLEQLQLEQKHAIEQLALAQQSHPSFAAEVQRLYDHSQAHAAEINRIESERNSVITPITADLDRVQRELVAASQESVAVEKEQQQRFVALGQALYDSKATHPAIASDFAQVLAIDRSRAVTQSALQSSLVLTHAMRSGTMFKFWATVLLVPLFVVAGGSTGAYFLLNAGKAVRTPVSWVQQEEDHKTDTVNSYLRGLRDPSKRDPSYALLQTASAQILKDDIDRLARTGDQAYLPRLAKVLRSDNPELRLAAADAIRRIGPTPAEVPALGAALNDAIPGVRFACLHALERVNKDARAQLFISRSLDELRSAKSAQALVPEGAPDVQQLGLPIYPNATFLHFASNVSEGRAAFSSADSLDKVVSFYQSKSQRGPLTGDAFGREYLGSLVLSSAAVQQLADQSRAALSGGDMSSLSAAPANPNLSPDTQMLQCLVLRYSDDKLYGSPAYVVSEETTTGDQKRPTKFVMIFQDRSLKATGFIIHFPPS